MGMIERKKTKVSILAATMVLAAGHAVPASAASTQQFNVGVDISGIYEDVTRFSVACSIAEGSDRIGASANGLQFLRDLVNGQYVGRWKDTLTLTFSLRGDFHFDQPGGLWDCRLYLDDQSGNPVGAPLQVIRGNFPLTYLGQFTYRGRPPVDRTHTQEGSSNGGAGMGGMGSTKLHIFKP